MGTNNLSKTSPLYITRFVAAYLVLIFHYHVKSMEAVLPVMRHFGEPVNYFFFISGFVMVLSNKRYLQFGKGVVNFSKADFWLKRIARIYPMYALALFLFVLFNYTIQEIDDSIHSRVWLEIIAIHRWIYRGSVNYPDWSVSCEFFFYFLFPFTLPWLVKNALKKVFIVTLALFIFNLVFTKYYEDVLPKLLELNHTTVYKLLTSSVLLHPLFKYTIFLFGCLCGRFYLESAKMQFVEKFKFPILLISLAAIVFFCKYDPVSDIFFDAGILCFAYFPFVLSICSFKGKVLQVFSWQPFIFLGEISYGLYIMQAPIEHYFEYLFTGNKRFTTNAQFFSYTLFLILVCSILYYIYEIPAKKLIIKYFKQKSLKNPSPAITIQH